MERLRELRKARHLTQEQLAEKFGVQKITISRYENGEREPNFYTLNKLASYFDVSVDFLIGNDQPDPHSQSPPQQKSPQDEGDNPVMQEIKELLPKLSKDEMEKALSYLKFLEESE